MLTLASEGSLLDSLTRLLQQHLVLHHKDEERVDINVSKESHTNTIRTVQKSSPSLSMLKLMSSLTYILFSNPGSP